MSRYVLVESRDPFESRTFSRRCELAIALRSDGAPVTVFLVENAVLAARAAANVAELPKMAAAGISVLVDEFALRERGVDGSELASAARPAGLEKLVEALAAGAKAVWN